MAGEPTHQTEPAPQRLPGHYVVLCQCEMASIPTVVQPETPADPFYQKSRSFSFAQLPVDVLSMIFELLEARDLAFVRRLDHGTKALVEYIHPIILANQRNRIAATLTQHLDFIHLKGDLVAALRQFQNSFGLTVDSWNRQDISFAEIFSGLWVQQHDGFSLYAVKESRPSELPEIEADGFMTRPMPSLGAIDCPNEMYAIVNYLLLLADHIQERRIKRISRLQSRLEKFSGALSYPMCQLEIQHLCSALWNQQIFPKGTARDRELFEYDLPQVMDLDLPTTALVQWCLERLPEMNHERMPNFIWDHHEFTMPLKFALSDKLARLLFNDFSHGAFQMDGLLKAHILEGVTFYLASTTDMSNGVIVRE